MNASHKWQVRGGWKVGRIVMERGGDALRMAFVQEYHTGRVYWISSDELTPYAVATEHK